MSAKIRLSPEEKLRIFIEGLKDNVKITEICRREELWPNEYTIGLRKRSSPEL